eukprot:6212325-Pleurochrysis_carterae.AAC.1
MAPYMDFWRPRTGVCQKVPELLQVCAIVCPAELGREVARPGGAHRCATSMGGNDVVDVQQHDQHVRALGHVEEAIGVLGLREAIFQQLPGGLLVPMPSCSGETVE